MFIFLKLLESLVFPPSLVAIGMLLSLLLWRRGKNQWGKRILLLAVVVYYLLSIQPIAYGLAYGLENKFFSTSTDTASLQNIKAIVVLAGGAHKKEGRYPFAELGGTSWKRLWHGIELYRELDGKVPILYSGGSGDPFDTVSDEAELARQYALSMGIPQEKFLIESASRNTYESAVAVKNFLDEYFPKNEQHRIILVTSASHMLRSLKATKKVDVAAVPAAVDFTTGFLKITPLSFFPSASSFSYSMTSIHEWAGMLGYWLFGRI